MSSPEIDSHRPDQIARARLPAEILSIANPFRQKGFTGASGARHLQCQAPETTPPGTRNNPDSEFETVQVYRELISVFS